MVLAEALVGCPTWAPALGFGGATIALVFACIGSAYGTGKAGMGISHVGVHKPEVCAHPPSITTARCAPLYGRLAVGALRSRVSLTPSLSLGVCARVAQIVMKNIIPVVMAGVLGIYGLIIAVIIGNGVKPFGSTGRIMSYSTYTGFAHLAGGMCCGLSGMSAGIAIGIVGDAGVRAVAMQPKMYVGMVLILIFAEALGLYGLIVGLIMSSNLSKGEESC